MNEARLLARVQHRNVVNLIGFCAHRGEKLLVYEYVANESLDKLLFGKASSLSLSPPPTLLLVLMANGDRRIVGHLIDICLNGFDCFFFGFGMESSWQFGSGFDG